MKTVWRHILPFDGEWTPFELHSIPKSVATVGSPLTGYQAEFWAEHDDSAVANKVELQMFGTGQELPAGPVLLYLATAPRTENGLVFHLYMRWDDSMLYGVDPMNNLG